MLTVSEIEIARAMRTIAIGERWMVEGAAGVAVAGLVQAAERYRGQRLAAILCGRNIAPALFQQAMRMAADCTGDGWCERFGGPSAEERRVGKEWVSTWRSRGGPAL